MKVFFSFLALLALTAAKPTSNSFKEVVQESIDDVGNILKAKSALLKYTGEAVGEAAEAAAHSTYELVGSIDAVEAANAAQEAVIEAQMAATGAVFDAKRAAILAARNAVVKNQAAVAAVAAAAAETAAAAAESAAAAAASASSGIASGKEVVVEFTSDLSIEDSTEV